MLRFTLSHLGLLHIPDPVVESQGHRDNLVDLTHIVHYQPYPTYMIKSEGVGSSSEEKLSGHLMKNLDAGGADESLLQGFGAV